MSTAGNALALKSRPSVIDWSQASIGIVAGIAALAIVGLLVTTLIFSAVTIAVSVPLGFVFAWLIERTDLPYKAVAMSLLSIGILFPTFLKAMGWVFLCHPRIGVINIFLMQLFGLKNAPLNIATLGGIGFVQGLTLAPLAYVMIS